jgi:hypothetical protein
MARVDNILDTNVLIIANGGLSPQSTPECHKECLERLFSITAGERRLVIDGGPPNGSEILAEYRNYFQGAGGAFGEVFFRWILNNWRDTQHVEVVPISPRDDSYEEFPADPRLKEFDIRDRKWVATARAHHQYNDIIAPIVQAADMKWKDYTQVFQEYYVEVDFLCDMP